MVVELPVENPRRNAGKLVVLLHFTRVLSHQNSHPTVYQGGIPPLRGASIFSEALSIEKMPGGPGCPCDKRGSHVLVPEMPVPDPTSINAGFLPGVVVLTPGTHNLGLFAWWTHMWGRVPCPVRGPFVARLDMTWPV